MTHIVNPFSQRLGIIRDWRSKWFLGGAGAEAYKSSLKADVLLREYFAKELRSMYVGEILMERNKDDYKIFIHTSRPGVIIGKSGDGIEKIRNKVLNFAKKKKLDIPVNFKIEIVEISSPESNAQIVAYMVVESLEKRMPFRRVLKTTVEKVMANRDVKGVRIALSGRLGGADMARKEEIRKGNVPLQTIRADVDFCKERANMTYGVIGVKVWIYRGMKFEGAEAKRYETRERQNDTRKPFGRDGDRRDVRRFDRNGERKDVRNSYRKPSPSKNIIKEESK
jgi:small subunit ribosomal protein S3